MDSIVHLTIALDVPLHREICRLAAASGRSTSWVIDRALRTYVAAELAGIEADGERSRSAGAIDEEDAAARRARSPRQRRPGE